MKRYLYVLCVIVSFSGLIACSKNNDPAPTSPVVGRWTLDKGLLSGFTGSNTSLNGIGIDLYDYDSFSSTIDVYADNTFNENSRQITVGDDSGTWDFSNETLTLKYDLGAQRAYKYAKTKNIEELTLTPSVSFTLPVSATATAVGQLQLVYRK